MTLPFSASLAQERQQQRFMPEIQALRAVAVGLVVAFHLFPGKWFTGGFVGVDVFFVISGYLITTHLLREADSHGTIRLLSFYARRVRRLLPASLLVLFVSLCASVIWIPDRYLLPTAREGVAATFYVENLWLASKAVTYSASNDLASPLQHYWSLSAEEQFYFFWPGLMILGIWLGKRFLNHHTQRSMATILVLALLLSLGFSIWYTPLNPAMAYFITPTRVWQFATGALTSFFLRVFAPVKWADIVIRWTGLAMILVSAWVITQADPFPGWLAIPATFGAAMVIIAGDTGPRDPLTIIANLKLVQWFGDISYSVYLWHWPLIVLTPFAIGGPLFWPHKLAILIASCALAHFTRKYVEIPGQSWIWLKSSNRRTFASMLIAMGILTGSALGYAHFAVWRQGQQSNEMRRSIATDLCLGAGATTNTDHCADPFSTPPRFEITEQESPWGQTGCAGEPRVCWGQERPEKILALVGDSHAESLYWAIAPLAEKAGWGVATVLEGGCPPNYAPSTTFQGQPRFGGRCADAAYRTTEVLRELKPDLIVASAYAEEGFESDEIAIVGYHQVLEDWLEIAPVTVIRDYPSTVGKNMPQCVALNANNHLACANERGSALPEDLLYNAATILDNPQIQLIDLTDLYCDETTCYPVVGSLPVYYDSDHIARSFALTLVPVLTEKLTLPSL